MPASTFKLKTNLLTAGRSHTPLAKSGGLTMGLNFYTPGRKNKLHTHPGEDHAFVVIDGQATFYDKDNKPTVLNKGEGIMLPDGYYYYFESTGTVPLAILRSSAARRRQRRQAHGRGRGLCGGGRRSDRRPVLGDEIIFFYPARQTGSDNVSDPIMSVTEISGER